MSFVNLLYITNHIAVTCPIIENGNCQFSNSVALKSAVNDWESQGCSTDPSCSTIETYGHVTTWCTSGITDMSNLFDGKSTFNEPIGSFDTSSVTTMNRMIHHAHDFNQPIGSWNTSKVRNMAGMFNNARSFNQNVAGWNVSSVETMFQMFAGAFAFNQPNLCPWKDAPALINNNDENMFLDSLGGGPKATDNSFDASLCVSESCEQRLKVYLVVYLLFCTMLTRHKPNVFIIYLILLPYPQILLCSLALHVSSRQWNGHN